MADVAQPFTCDFCHVLKREANHWFRVWADGDHIGISLWSCKLEYSHFHACGEDHALKLAARLLGKKME